MTLKNNSLTQRVQQELDSISLNSKTLIRENSVTVAGNSGWKIEYRDTDKYADQYVFVIYTIANGKFYVLRYVEEPLKVPETLPLANKMVESFRVNTADEDTRNNPVFEGTNNNSAFENFQNKHCPPMSLVLCEPPPELEEPQD